MRRRLARADVLTEMNCAVNASLEPERVVDAIVARVSACIPTPGWLVLASTEDGEIRSLVSRGIPSTLRAAAHAVGELVARSTRPFYSADIAADRRVPKAEPQHPPAAAIGFPLECRGRTVGALIGIDRTASAREPKLAAATLSALRNALEPGAFAKNDVYVSGS